MRFLKVLIPILLVFTAFSCKQERQEATQSQDHVQPAPEKQHETFAVVEFGANAVRGDLYEYRGAGVPIEKLKGKIKNGYVNTQTADELFNTVSTQVHRKFPEQTTPFYYVSSGFQNAFPEISKSLRSIEELEFITPEQEAYWEWVAATSGGDVNGVSIGMGGGSVQIGCNYREKTMHIPVGTQTVLETQEKLPTLNTYLRGRDKIYLTGGAAFLVLWHGLKAEPQVGTKYGIEVFDEGLKKLQSPEDYETNTLAYDIPDFDLPRDQLYAAGLVLQALIQQVGSDKTIYIGPNMSWSVALAKAQMEKRI